MLSTHLLKKASFSLTRAFSAISSSAKLDNKAAETKETNNASPSPTIEERVIAVLKLHDKVPRESLDISNSWSKMGLDSLDVVEVMIALEDEFNLEIPDHIADRVGNPFEISQYIQGRLDE